VNERRGIWEFAGELDRRKNDKEGETIVDMTRNISVDYAGVKLRNPIILGSATPGWDGKHLADAEAAGVGAVVCKTIGPPAEWAAHPRNGRLAFVEVNGKRVGMVNLELFTTKTVEDWINYDLAVAKDSGAVVIASILALPSPAETGELAAWVEATGQVDLLELNVSCPMPACSVGMHIGKDPTKTYAQVRAVKAATKLPLSVKMTPNIADIGAVAVACREAGADGLTVANSVRSFAGVDIYTGLPRLRAFGGYSGPAIRPITQRLVIEVKQACDLPVCAVGGITKWQDVVEYIMIGAQAVQVATGVMWRGWGIIGKLLDGLCRFMGEQGYSSLDDFRGLALPYVTTVEQLAQEPKLVAEVDHERCTACGLCVGSCFYDALALDETLQVDTDRCDGCGLCVLLCPQRALSLE